MNTSHFAEILKLPKRGSKPRDVGLTHVLDKGMGLSALGDALDVCSEYVDIVKLGWGTSVITPVLNEKIRLLQERGVQVCLGGTILELFIARGEFEAYVDWVAELGLRLVEVSDGVIELAHTEKLAYIERLSKDFTVLSEIGSKDENVVTPPYRWMEMAAAELKAGAWKVIGEARESGTAGMYRNTGEVRAGLIDEVVSQVGPENWIFETPQKSQQVWFIKRFGPNVSLGNIPMSEVLPVETLRLGLRADTFDARGSVNGKGHSVPLPREEVEGA